jgi:DNA replication protein DnaC
MLIQQTLEILSELKLQGMARGLSEQIENPQSGHLSFEERLSLLVDQERCHRDNTRLQRLLRQARLREPACMEDIDYRAGRGIERGEMSSYALCDWITRKHNMIITGPTGCGKTWLACALGNQACRKGLSVSFQRLPLMLEDLAIAHGDGTFRARLNTLAKVDLLIIDDFGIAALTPTGRNDLLEVIDQRTGNRATLVTSQLPVELWHEYLSGGKGNTTLADSILDRVLSGSLRITLKGESMRKREARKAKSGS